MKRAVTCKGGPLDGKSYLVPASVKVIDHPALTGGRYPVNGPKAKTTTWVPDKESTSAQASD